ncbi:MAG: 6,7-dimethyl-8-ribityllumazine synthase [Candidatus Nezhaarchaeota archaeon]|nr:6,7-dimethyl-8-ribityllumazine synthase [Candidatus Nezhaarchaeota archaeon]MCX8141593.1 6,7-dimethyl-8-ribityllumazine synthase [Candidatus Nezhaarchaeota archaeon]MDW8049860.1 6,7-dimethyl-8-ribityllumazine synthase [Nitrososphaerota archaeon]
MVEKIRLAIVVSEFNFDVTYLMLQKALDHAKVVNADVKVVVRVPGTFELPIAVAALISRDDVDAVVTLGAVIKGETEHDEVVAHQTARKLLDLSLQYEKPVSLGIIGPGATRAQAQARIEEYARRAVEAAVKTVLALREVKGSMREGVNKA